MGFLIINFVNFSNLSLFGSLFFFLIYILITLSFFFILLLFMRVKTTYFLENLKSFSLLSGSYRLLGYCLIISLFSIIGIPPLAGFFMKLIVLENLLNSSEFVLIFILILFTVFASFYYLRIIRKIFFKREYKSVLFVRSKNFTIISILNLSGFNMLFIFLIPFIVFNLNNICIQLY